MQVGFIGLGHMGAGMAASLLKAGHEVTVYNRTPAKAERLLAQGARLAAMPAPMCPRPMKPTCMTTPHPRLNVQGDEALIVRVRIGARTFQPKPAVAYIAVRLGMASPVSPR